MKIKVIIERGKDLYGAYSEDVPGVWGSGETVAEAKASVLKTIELLEKYNEGITFPDLEISYQFDLESFLAYYKGIFTNSALERLTGVNQKLLQHYSTGLRKPRPAQRKKIEKALHRLGEELLSLEL